MLEKIWDRHVVRHGPGDWSLLYIDRHLLHEGASAAFERLAKSGRTVRRPGASVATADHYVATTPGDWRASEPEMRQMVERLAESAPSAPWVAVWESPQTRVMPGWVMPCSGPMT